MSKLPLFLFFSLLTSTSAFALSCSDGSTGCAGSDTAKDCQELGYSLNEPECDHYLLCPFNTAYKICTNEKAGADNCPSGTMTKAECDSKGGTFLGQLSSACGVCSDIIEDTGCTAYTKSDCQEWEVKIANSQTLTYYQNCRTPTSTNEAVNYMGDACIENTQSCQYKAGDNVLGFAATTGQSSSGAYYGQGGQTWSDPCVGSIIAKFIAPVSNDIGNLQSVQNKCKQIETAYQEAVKKYNKCCHVQYGTKEMSATSPFDCDKCKIPSGTSSSCGSAVNQGWVHHTGI